MKKNSYVALFFVWLLLIVFDLNAETRKFAVVLGNNQGHDPDKKLKYAEQDAVKLRDVLIELGGFLPDDVVLVLDKDADQAWESIQQMEKKLSRLKGEPNSKTLLILYYSGHAEGDVMELGKSSLGFGDLLQYLRRSSADVRMAFLDSCQSGKLIATKGGRRGPEFSINVTDEMNSNGYAIITSSAHNELSQESVEIHGGFFTHYLVSALRGAGDKSKDGRITLNEAYEYVYSRTLARTSATIGASQHPMYEFQLQGRGEIVLTNTDRSNTHISVRLPESGRFLLVHESQETVIAEAAIEADKSVVFSVRPGNYRAYLIADNNIVRQATVHAIDAETAKLDGDHFQTIELETPVPRGGLFPETESHLTHRLEVGGVWRMWPLENGISSYGASVHYLMEMPSGFEPGVKLTWTTRQDTGVSTGYHDIGLSLGAGYAKNLSVFLLRTSILAGYEQLFQDEREGKKRTTPGFNYLLSLGAELALGARMFASVDLAGGGRVFEIVDKGIVHRFDLQVVLSLGFKWID